MAASRNSRSAQIHRELTRIQQAIARCWDDLDRELRVLADLTERLTSDQQSLREMFGRSQTRLFALRTQHGRSLDNELAGLIAALCSESNSVRNQTGSDGQLCADIFRSPTDEPRQVGSA